MTTEQLPPEPHEHRRSRWWPWDGVGRFGRPQPFESDETESEPSVSPAPPADDGAPTENGSVIQGAVVSEDQHAASEAADQQQQALEERLPLPPTFRQELRMQLADFAERAHQQRLNPDGAQLLGQGGGITDVVVRAMAEEISAHELPSPVDNQTDRTLLLFGALAAAGIKQKKTNASFVIVRGRLMLDVSTADVAEEQPSIRFVRLPDRPELPDQEATSKDAAGADAAGADAAGADAAGEGDAGHDSAGQDAAGQNAHGQAVVGQDVVSRDSADHTTAEHDPTVSEHDGTRPTRYAAVICGPAASIAGRRPFLGMDALMTYARRQAVIKSGEAADPDAARRAMRVAHGIEIVVLLDPSLGGGVWVDVDPATGRSAATMSIDLTSAGFEFMPLTAA